MYHVEEETSALVALLLAALAIAAAFLFLAPPADAERPFRTDDPYTAGMHQWETAGGITVGSGSWENVTGRSQVDFEIGVDYGFAERMELGVDASLFRVNDPGADGFGRFDAHFKHQFGEATPEWPDMGYDIRLRIPGGRRVDPLGDGRPEFGVAYLLGWRGDRWTTTARIGAVQTLSDRLDNRYEAGIAGRYLVSPGVKLLGEIWYDTNEKPRQSSRLEFGAGISYLTSRQIALDLMLVAGTRDSTPDVTVKAGLTHRL